MSEPHKKWMKLDNAAKIYPATMTRAWMALFRFSTTLIDPIEPQLLQRALDRTLRRFPSMAQKLKKGFFWFYMEHNDKQLVVQPDVGNPCVRMDFKENNGFMLRVRYHENRIAVEFFHMLTDGTGGLSFLKTLTAEYIFLRYGVRVPAEDGVLDCDESPRREELEDSFAKYARGMTRSRREAKSYFIPGTEEEHFMHITTGLIDVQKALELSRGYGCSLTELLTSVLILSIDELQLRNRPKRRKLRPVKVSVPVNLRNYYPSPTVRNFSSFVNPGIEPKYGQYTLEETIKQVKGFMAKETDEKLLNARFSTNVMSERHRVMRMVPLFIKSQAMKVAFLSKGDKQSSSTLTNLGNVKIPKEMTEYVARMDVQLGPLKRNRVGCAVLSYNGTLMINFTRKIMESQVERNFFTRLVRLGLKVVIESNQQW